MFEQLSRQVSAAAKALSKKTRGAAFIGVYVKLPVGRQGLAWAVDEASSVDLEKMIIALLNSIAEEAAGGMMTCNGCVDRYERARAALKALQGDGVQPQPHLGH